MQIDISDASIVEMAASRSQETAKCVQSLHVEVARGSRTKTPAKRSIVDIRCDLRYAATATRQYLYLYEVL